MKKRELIKQHLSQLNLKELLKYRLLFCSSEPTEDLELDITDLFKCPTRLKTSYVDNWQKDVLKALFLHVNGQCESSSQMDEAISDLLLKQIFSDKDNRILGLFEHFLASLQSSNVELIHASLHRKLDTLKF
jgi:hypothetical protein